MSEIDKIGEKIQNRLLTKIEGKLDLYYNENLKDVTDINKIKDKLNTQVFGIVKEYMDHLMVYEIMSIWTRYTFEIHQLARLKGIDVKCVDKIEGVSWYIIYEIGKIIEEKYLNKTING